MIIRFRMNRNEQGPLPKRWTTRVSKTTGKPYYTFSQWERPKAIMVAEAPRKNGNIIRTGGPASLPRQQDLEAPKRETIEPPVREARPNIRTGGPASLPRQQDLEAPPKENIPQPIRERASGGRNRTRKASRKHKKRKATKRTARR